jgi:terminase small subunit / prophage DNA-packing protein
MLVNKTQLAAWLGYSERSLSDWALENPPMPIVQKGERGEENVYDSGAVVAWLVSRAQRQGHAASARDDLYRSQKRLADLQIAEKERSLVDAAAVEEKYSHLVLHARQRLLQLPGLMHGRLEPAVLAQLEEAIHGALRELAAYKPAEVDADA